MDLWKEFKPEKMTGLLILAFPTFLVGVIYLLTLSAVHSMRKDLCALLEAQPVSNNTKSA